MAWSWTVVVAGLLMGQVAGDDVYSPEAIAAAVARLGANRFELREQASDFLWRAGERGREALVQAARSTDREVVRRAKDLLEKLDLGIHPDTPPAEAALLRSYRAADETQRQTILDGLHEAKSFDTLLRLLRHEHSERLRSQQVEKLVRNREAITKLYIDGRHDDLDRMMPFLALSPDRHEIYAAYVALTGKLDSKMAELQGSTGDVERLLLVRLLRMQGKTAEALKLVQQIPFEDRDRDLNYRRRQLEAELLQAMGDWAAMAKIIDNSTISGIASDGGVELLGQSAFFHRLAGSRERFEARVVELKEHARKEPEDIWYCLEALLINDRFADAAQVARDHGPDHGVEILEKLLHYRESLELAGWTGSTSAAEWCAKAFENKPDNKKQPDRSAYRAVELAKMLARLGKRDEAAELFKQTVERSQDNVSLLSMVFKAERQMQLPAWRDHTVQAIERISKQSDESFGGSLLGVVGDSSGAWWTFIRAQVPQDTLLESLDRLDNLVGPRFGRSKLNDEQRTLVEQAVTSALSLEGELKRRRLAEIGDLCQQRGETELARRCYREFVMLLSTEQGWLKLGDLSASDSQWEAAAEAYQASWLQAKDPLPLYLHGAMLAKLGRQEEADKAQRLARFLPIFDATNRAHFASGLEERQLKDQAISEWQFVIRSSDISEWGMGNALQHFGNSQSKEHPLEAAVCWERLRFTALRTSSGFINVDNYFHLASTIHRVRSRGLIAQEQIEPAFAAAQLSIDAKPGDVDNAISLMQMFQTAKQPARAQAIYDRMERQYLQLIEEFPNSAQFHNGFAWLLVKTDHDLDQALKHARRAVEINPDDAPPIDTLALVLHKRGEHREAVELARRCTQLEPGDTHFQEQLVVS